MIEIIFFLLLFFSVAFWLWNKDIDKDKELERWRWLYGNKRNDRKNTKEKKDFFI